MAPIGSLSVAVDAMGGDHAPEIVVAGAVEAAKRGIPVTLVGDRERISALVPRGARVQVVHAADAVGMGEGGASLRRRPEASVRVAARLVKEGQAGAMVSCGDTAATLFAAVIELGVLEGVDRPAIATLLPRSDGGRLVLLDAGANVDCRPEQLLCFALLGAAYAEAMGVSPARVGLLSNGEEEGKGNMQVKATLPLLLSSGLLVVGPVEPQAAMEGACDVLVCDGFVGNVLLKAAEGAVGVGVQILKQELAGRPSAWMGAALMRGVLRRFRERVAWDAHGGAFLLGARGIVVVGHGRANAESVCAAITQAHGAISTELVESVARRLRAG